MSAPEAQQKSFGKSGTREIPHHSQKAQKWYVLDYEEDVIPEHESNVSRYPADDESQHKKVHNIALPTELEVWELESQEMGDPGICDDNYEDPGFCSHNLEPITNCAVRFANPSALPLLAQASSPVPS